jgi:hypothetical protein
VASQNPRNYCLASNANIDGNLSTVWNDKKYLPSAVTWDTKHSRRPALNLDRFVSVKIQLFIVANR